MSSINPNSLITSTAAADDDDDEDDSDGRHRPCGMLLSDKPMML